MKQIFILSSCNEWKEPRSMSLILATTIVSKVRLAIITRIRRGDMNYKCGHDDLSKEDQACMFREDFSSEGQKFAFDNIEYGYVKVVNDGEVQ